MEKTLDNKLLELSIRIISHYSTVSYLVLKICIHFIPKEQLCQLLTHTYTHVTSSESENTFL